MRLGRVGWSLMLGEWQSGAIDPSPPTIGGHGWGIGIASVQ
jgi:hypothetical protein